MSLVKEEKYSARKAVQNLSLLPRMYTLLELLSLDVKWERSIITINMKMLYKNAHFNANWIKIGCRM